MGKENKMTQKPTDLTPTPKLTRATMHKGIVNHHAHIVGAVHQMLKDAGLNGVTVHSMRFAAPEDFDDPCDPPCKAGQRCVLDSNGGDVHWVCVPDNS
jgi:hypothetical protein